MCLKDRDALTMPSTGLPHDLPPQQPEEQTSSECQTDHAAHASIPPHAPSETAARAYRLGNQALESGMLKDALAAAQRGLAHDLSPVDQMHLLKLSADAYRAMSDYQHAGYYYQLSLEIARQVSASAFEAQIMTGLGRTAGNQGAYAAAEVYYDAALSIFSDIDDWSGVAASLNNLGTIAIRQGKLTPARGYHEKSLALYRELDDEPRGIAQSLQGLGEVSTFCADFATARICFEECLELWELIGDRKAFARSLNDLANILIQQGEFDTARSRIRHSLRIHREIGDLKGVAANLQSLGMAAHNQKDYATACSHMKQALQIQKNIGYQFGMVATRMVLAQLCLKLGDHSNARVYLREALANSQRTGARQKLMETMLVCAEYLTATEEVDWGAEILGMVKQANGSLEPGIESQVKNLERALQCMISLDRLEYALNLGARLEIEPTAARLVAVLA